MAQTKLISFKSHSGKIRHFRTALKTDPTLKRSDFGDPPIRYSFDTVVFYPKKGLVLVNVSNYKFVTSIKTDTIWRQPPNRPSPSKDSIATRIRTKYYDSFYRPRFIFKGFDADQPSTKK
jgi:hypothetical protein